MDGEHLTGMIIMAFCCFGSGMIFLCLGIHADKCQHPVKFWAGSELKIQWVSDVYAYNRENAVMWKRYSLPYFLSGILGCVNWLHDGFLIASLVVLVAAGFPGIWMLIRQYRKIELKYIDPKGLDKIDPIC